MILGCKPVPPSLHSYSYFHFLLQAKCRGRKGIGSERVMRVEDVDGSIASISLTKSRWDSSFYGFSVGMAQLQNHLDVSMCLVVQSVSLSLKTG